MKREIMIIACVGGMSLSLYATSAEDIAKEKGCMSCHQISGKKSAPAFRGVANRNLHFNPGKARESIKESIEKGSKGKYPGVDGREMPAYPQLSQEELDTLADWILSLGKSGMGRHGMHGHGMGGGRGGMFH